MYRLLIILLLAGCVKEKTKHPFAVDNGVGWQGMYEYLTPKGEGFMGMDGGYNGGWLGSFKGCNNDRTGDFRFNTITSGEINFIIIDTISCEKDHWCVVPVNTTTIIFHGDTIRGIFITD